MKDTPEPEATSRAAETRRPGPRWLIVLLLWLGTAAWIRMWRPERDPRLVGEWQSSSGLIRRYHADGRFELQASTKGPLLVFGRPDSWRTENGEVIHFRERSVAEHLTRSFQNLFSRPTGVLRVGFSDERCRILELTDTALTIQQVREPPARPRAAEMFRRTMP
jgi:hypothetical protein